MIRRIEWAAKMALGWCCYHWVMCRSDVPSGWALSWSGFYAYDTGFEDWLWRLHQRRGRADA